MWITLADDDIRRRFPAYGMEIKCTKSKIFFIDHQPYRQTIIQKLSKFFITLDLGE